MSVGKIFKRGLIVLAPMAISLVLLVWLFKRLEQIFKVPLHGLLGPYYFPGMGILVAVICIFLFGLVINNFLIQRWYGWFDKLFAKIPLFKTIYNSIRDLMNYFGPKDGQRAGKVVVIEIDGMRFLGILTREDFTEMPPGLGEEGWVTVFVPLSYQIGGFTTTVPRSRVKPIDMTVEQGMRFVITAGVVGDKGGKEEIPSPNKAPKNL